MTTPHVQPPPNGSGPSELIIAGCSAEKTSTNRAVPALDLYNGGCVPALRARLGHLPHLRARIRFLSAKHGLIDADTQLSPYDRPLDPVRATQLRPVVWSQLQTVFRADEMPTKILVVAEPLYLVLLADLLADAARPRIFWIPDHAHGWPAAAAILDDWGW